MLVAKTNDGKVIALQSGVRRRELERMRTQLFFCPACQGRVLLKIGQLKIPHFAHVSQKHCAERFSEGESLMHLKGKQQLYDFLKKYGDATLEATLPTIQQRPDILIDDVAVEFQCSPLSIKRFQQRNDGYRKAAKKPYWIPYFDDIANGVQHITLSKDLQKYRRNGNLLCYNPTHEQFIYMSSLLALSKTKFIGYVILLPLSFQTWPFRQVRPLTNEHFHVYVESWMRYREAYVARYRQFHRAKDPLLTYLYEQRLGIFEIPEEVGVPIFGYEGEFPLYWQLIYRRHYYPNGVDSFLYDAPFPITKKYVQAYDDFLHAYYEKKESIIQILYGQYVAFQKEN